MSDGDRKAARDIIERACCIIGWDPDWLASSSLRYADLLAVGTRPLEGWDLMEQVRAAARDVVRSWRPSWAEVEITVSTTTRLCEIAEAAVEEAISDRVGDVDWVEQPDDLPFGLREAPVDVRIYAIAHRHLADIPEDWREIIAYRLARWLGEHVMPRDVSDPVVSAIERARGEAAIVRAGLESREKNATWEMVMKGVVNGRRWAEEAGGGE